MSKIEDAMDFAANRVGDATTMADHLFNAAYEQITNHPKEALAYGAMIGIAAVSLLATRGRAAQTIGEEASVVSAAQPEIKLLTGLQESTPIGALNEANTAAKLFDSSVTPNTVQTLRKLVPDESRLEALNRMGFK